MEAIRADGLIPRRLSSGLLIDERLSDKGEPRSVLWYASPKTQVAVADIITLNLISIFDKTGELKTSRNL